MPLRRQIAFVSILVASMVLFVHAVVPHHHHAAGAGICTEAAAQTPACCNHGADAGTSGESLPGESHDCDHCEGVGCNPTLPFKLGHSAEFGSEMLPAVILLALTDVLNLIQEEGKAELTPAEPHLISQCVLTSLPRRAPPVLA